LPARDAVRIAAAIKALEDDPFPRGALKLSGSSPPVWRLRVGEYRIIYGVSTQREIIFVEAILRRTSQTYERF